MTVSSSLSTQLPLDLFLIVTLFIFKAALAASNNGDPPRSGGNYNEMPNRYPDVPMNQRQHSLNNNFAAVNQSNNSYAG